MTETDGSGIDIPASWPNELGRKVHDHGGLIPRITGALVESGLPATAEHLWDALARMHSSEWSDARDVLDDARAHLRHLRSPENMSLGPIGRAMNAEEETAAEDAEVRAQAVFTVIDEELRINPHMQQKMETLERHQQTIETSVQISLTARAATRALNEIDIPAPAKKSGLGKLFASFSTRRAAKPVPELARPAPQALAPETN